jgi:hypothetical protein
MAKQIKINKVVIDNEGKKYIPIGKSGIPALYILTDSIKQTKFEGDNKIYVAVEEILRWMNEELKLCSDKNKEILNQNIKFFKKLEE